LTSLESIFYYPRRKGKAKFVPRFSLSHRSKNNETKIGKPISILFLVFIGALSGLVLPPQLNGQKKEKPKALAFSLFALLQEEKDFPDTADELAPCYDLFQDMLRAEEHAAKEKTDEAAEEFMKKLEHILSRREASAEKTPEQEMKRIEQELRQLASETDLEAMFPRSSEARFIKCQQNKKEALRQLELADELESCYVTILKRIGFNHLAATEETEERNLWRQEVECFTCGQSEERLPLQTIIEVPAGSKRPFVIKTFCLEGDLLRPGDGEEYTIAGDVESLGLENLQLLLEKARSNPETEIDIQKAIWEEGKKDKEKRGAGSVSSSRSMKTGKRGRMSLAEGVQSGLLDAKIRTRDGFSSVEIIIGNLTHGDLSVDLSGVVLNSQDSDSQSLATAGVDTEQPPPAPPLKTPEQRIEEILNKVREILKKAIETVKNGDHTRQALKELLEALRLAEWVGLDDEMEEGWDTVRDGLMKETRDAYKEYKENPWRENYDRLVDDLRALDDMDPPKGCEEEFQKMLEDIFG
jgi:hypothetical protein